MSIINTPRPTGESPLFGPYPEPDAVARMSRETLVRWWLRVPPPANAVQEEAARAMVSRLVEEGKPCRT